MLNAPTIARGGSATADGMTQVASGTDPVEILEVTGADGSSALYSASNSDVNSPQIAVSINAFDQNGASQASADAMANFSYSMEIIDPNNSSPTPVMVNANATGFIGLSEPGNVGTVAVTASASFFVIPSSGGQAIINDQVSLSSSNGQIQSSYQGNASSLGTQGNINESGAYQFFTNTVYSVNLAAFVSGGINNADGSQVTANASVDPYFSIASPNASGDTFEFSPGVNNSPVCFRSGTVIRCASGDISVEKLSVGDHVVNASGEFRPIRWLGHRTIDCRRHPRPHEVMPIRVVAHAFGPNRPCRDLFVSPGHAICVDVIGQVLIPAVVLVNGTTIKQEPLESVSYWHIELDRHDVILAENLLCESYLDMGNRGFFAEHQIQTLHASPDTRAVDYADFCRPFHQDGAVVAFVRERLAARAPDLGWQVEQAPFAGLHLLVDGHRIEPDTRDLSARFLVPADANEVWLVSTTSVPSEIGVAADLRALGVCVGRLVIDDGFEIPRTIAVDHPLLCKGFYNLEEGPQRWTAGRALLPKALWEGHGRSFFLRIDLTRPALPRWVSPAESGTTEPHALAS